MSELITVSAIFNAQTKIIAKTITDIVFTDHFKLRNSTERILFLEYLLEKYPNTATLVDPDVINSEYYAHKHR